MQVDFMYPDDPAPQAMGFALAGSFADPLAAQWNECQCLFGNFPEGEPMAVRSADAYKYDVELYPEPNIWYRLSFKANVPSKKYDATLANLSTGEVFRLATGYAFRGDKQVGPEEGLGVFACWSYSTEDRYGRTFIDNIVLSNQPISTPVDDWSIR